MSRGKIVAPLAIVVTVVVSVIFAFATPQDTQRYVLFFRDVAGQTALSEWHLVPRRDTPRERVRALIDELALGPVGVGAVPIIPAGARVRSLVVRDRIVYVDFTKEAMFGDETIGQGFDDFKELLQKNLMHNFRWIADLVVLIDGQIPDMPIFKLVSR